MFLQGKEMTVFRGLWYLLNGFLRDWLILVLRWLRSACHCLVTMASFVYLLTQYYWALTSTQWGSTNLQSTHFLRTHCLSTQFLSTHLQSTHFSASTEYLLNTHWALTNCTYNVFTIKDSKRQRPVIFFCFPRLKAGDHYKNPKVITRLHDSVSNVIKGHRGHNHVWMNHTHIGSHRKKVGVSNETNSDVLSISTYCMKHCCNNISNFTLLNFWSARIMESLPFWISVLCVMYEKATWRLGILSWSW